MNGPVVLRRVKGDELWNEIYEMCAYAFMPPSPPLRKPDEAEQACWEDSKRENESFVLLENGQLMAVSSTVPMQHHVRGVLFPAWGVWGVTTHPAARRNGYARRTMLALHDAAHDAGMAFTTLYAFRESFYERLGYVMFPQPRKAIFSPAALAPILKWTLPGRVERTPIAGSFDGWLDYLRRHMLPVVHGAGLSNGRWPASYTQHRNDWWLAAAVIDDELCGAMLYRLESAGSDTARMVVRRFVYHDVRGRCLLLDWIARHIDQVCEVTIHLPPFEHPEMWLSDLEIALEAQDAGMGRVLDVTRIGGMQTGPGAFCARIHDDYSPWNEGVWRFETRDGVLCVSPADRADCDLTIQGLGGLVYGMHDPNGFPIRGWGDPTPDTQAVMRAMFPPRLPYLYEEF